MSKILGNTLPQEIIDLFDQEVTTVILSTLTAEGHPHALPIGLVYATDNQTIRMGLMKGHLSVENIKNDNRAFISVMDAPDLAVGIKGTAQIVKEPMEASPAMVMVEFKVTEVKSDTTPTAAVVQGLRYQSRTDKGADFLRAMFDEIKA